MPSPWWTCSQTPPSASASWMASAWATASVPGSRVFRPDHGSNAARRNTRCDEGRSSVERQYINLDPEAAYEEQRAQLLDPGPRPVAPRHEVGQLPSRRRRGACRRSGRARWPPTCLAIKRSPGGTMAHGAKRRGARDRPRHSGGHPHRRGADAGTPQPRRPPRALGGPKLMRCVRSRGCARSPLRPHSALDKHVSLHPRLLSPSRRLRSRRRRCEHRASAPAAATARSTVPAASFEGVARNRAPERLDRGATARPTEELVGGAKRMGGSYPSPRRSPPF